MAIFQKAARLFPENPYIHASPAQFVVQTGQPPTRETVEIIETALARDPFAFDLLWASGAYHLALGEREEAGTIFATFMIRAPRSAMTKRLTEVARASQSGALPP